jgi:hypothetical protein
MRQFQTIVHIAGPVEGNLQRCIRCGAILIDSAGAMSIDGSPMSYWAGFVGVTECVEEGRKVATNPTCSVQMDHDARESDEYPCGEPQ